MTTGIEADRAGGAGSTGGAARATLPSPIVRFLIGTVVNAMGNGLGFPFLFLYLHNVRHFTEFHSGLILGASGLVMIAMNVVGGSLVDRLGVNRQLRLGLAFQTLGYLAFMVTRTESVALVAAALNGLGWGMFQPAAGSVLASIDDRALRARASAYARVAMNLGVGIGGTIGGFIADRRHPETYVRMFGVNVLTFVVFGALIANVDLDRTRDPEAAGGSYRAVLRDHFYVYLLLVDLAIALSFAYAFEMMPGFAADLGLRERAIGFLFLANTATVVLVQVPAVRVFRGRSRMGWIVGMNAIFALGFVLMVSAVGRSIWWVAGLLGLAQVLFGLGECVLGGVRQPMTIELAPDALVGRYYGLGGMIFQVGLMFGKVSGGWLLGTDRAALYVVAAVVAGSGAIGAAVLAPRLAPELRAAPG